jgi:hypothetical protein
MEKRIEPYIERVDDLPVLFGLLQQMGIQAILDDIIVPQAESVSSANKDLRRR